MSEIYQRLAHSSWDCKYHVVIVPKRRRKVLFGQARRKLGEIFHALARQKECQILEGHLLPDHVHMCIAIPPKYPVASSDRISEREEQRWPACAARSGISRASTFAPVGTPCPQWASSWSKSASTSASKNPRMVTAAASNLIDQDAL